MPLFDALRHFDDALDWQLDDPLLADHLPSTLSKDPWPPAQDDS